MTGPRFDNRFTWSTIISGAMFVVAVSSIAVTWGQFDQRVTHLEEAYVAAMLDIRTNRDSISAQSQSIGRMDERLLSIERSAQRTETTVAEIYRYLREGAN